MLKTEPVWDPAQHPGSWRAVWAYSTKRAVRDNQTLTLQENRAKEVVAGEKSARTPRFVKTSNGTKSLDEASLARARRLVGLKGYVTNIAADVMGASEVIGSYHDLWHVEQSFRMSKTDLRARPMFDRTRDAIEAHLTIVFTALAVSPRGPEPHRPRDPQRRPPTTPAALSNHRDQRRRPDLPARRPRRPASPSSTHHRARNSRTKRLDLIETARHLAAASPGARLDPPLLLALDEIGNLSPLPSLPVLMAEGGGTGITTMPVLQSLSQARDKWGDHAAGAIWDASIVKVILGGTSSARDLQDLSALIGERDEKTDTVSVGDYGSRSLQRSIRRVPVMPPEVIRTLPFGTALVLLRSAPPLVTDLRPWTARQEVEQLRADRSAVE